MIFKFTLSGKNEQILDFEKDLLNILKRVFGNNDIYAHDVHFCIHESILNIIQHTYNWDFSQLVEVSINIHEDTENNTKDLEVLIRDHGKPISKPIFATSKSEKIDKFQLRERGIYMISKLMDEFYVKPDKKKGNITFMKKHYIMNEEADKNNKDGENDE